MELKKVGSVRKLKGEQKVLILEEASRISEELITSPAGRALLAAFAQDRCGIVIGDHTVKDILKGGNATGDDSHRSIRPSSGRFTFVH